MAKPETAKVLDEITRLTRKAESEWSKRMLRRHREALKRLLSDARAATKLIESLDSPSAYEVSRATRLEALAAQYAEALNAALRIDAGRTLEETFAGRGTMSQLMLAAQADLTAGASTAAIAQTAAFQTLDVGLIAAAERRFTSVAFEQWAQQLGNKVRDDLTQVLLDGWLAGDSPEAIQRQIRKVSSVGITRARLIARTETLNTQRAALQQLYQDAEQVQGWQWYSTRDSRTCPICWTLDGRRFISQDGTMPEMQTHPNCRCTMLPILPELDDILNETISIPENGSYPPNQSPSDRLESLSDKDIERIFGSGRMELLKRGRVTPEDVVIVGPPARLRTLPELEKVANEK